FLEQRPRLVERDPPAVAAVVHVARYALGACRLQIEFRHVLHEREVARVLAIAEDGGRLAVQHRLHEERQHPRIGARWGLPRAVHVEVAQRHRLQTVYPGKNAAVIFAHEFLERIGRFGPRRHALHFGEHVGIAIGRTGRGVDHASGLPFLSGPQYVEGAVDIDLVRRHRIVDGARHRRNRGFVEHHGRPPYQRRDLLIVPDVGALEFVARTNLLQVALPPGEQIIDRYHAARAFLQQFAYNGGADEARPSGDNVVAHDGSFPICFSRYRRLSLATRSAPGVKSKASSDTQPAYPRRRSTSRTGVKSWLPAPQCRPSSSLTCTWRMKSK